VPSRLEGYPWSDIAHFRIVTDTYPLVGLRRAVTTLESVDPVSRVLWFIRYTYSIEPRRILDLSDLQVAFEDECLLGHASSLCRGADSSPPRQLDDDFFPGHCL